MKYLISSFCIIFFSSIPICGCAQPWTLEGKAGAFIPTSSKMRHIFSTALPFLELEGGYQFSSNWSAWAGVGYIWGEGKSLGCDSKTTIDVVPFSLGIKWFFPLASRINGFLGVGGLWTLYRNHDYSQSVHQHISANAGGVIATSGLQYRLVGTWFLNFFAEYMYQHFAFSKVYSEHFTYRHDVNMSGTKIGLGILYNF